MIKTSNWISSIRIFRWLAIQMCIHQNTEAYMISLTLKKFISFTPLWITLIMLPSCATSTLSPLTSKAMPRIDDQSYKSFDGDSLGYKKWRPNKEPKTVIIGIHGISGHAGDYKNLSKHLNRSSKDIALYAPETRGQGMDPITHRKGDIQNPQHWYQDLYTFDSLIRKLHPKAEIIWFGESMGSLIVTHAYATAPFNQPKPDKVILSSPILDIKKKVPSWKRHLVRAARLILPTLRVSLETLSNGEKPTVTKQDIHEQQAAINPWYIPRYTLRLLISLTDMASTMQQAASTITCPLLIVHGGKDIFTESTSVSQFEKQLPQNSLATRLYYKGSYHLLMYDHDRETIFEDISKWLKK